MKVPKPRKLPSGSWFIQMRLGGESVPVTEAGEKACIKAAQMIKAEYLAGKREKPPEKPPITLSEAVDNYIAARSNTLSPSTLYGYKTIKRSRFLKVMDTPICDITDWQSVCNNEAKLCSAKTLHNAWLFLASVLREAGETVPKVTLPQIVREEKEFLDPDQIQKFIKTIRGRPCEIPALLALHSLRRSELLALTWKDIDLKKGVIAVNGAVVLSDKNTYTRKKTTKNTASRRLVPIMIPELKSALDAVENKSGAVVGGHPNTLIKQINKACRDSDLPEVGVHGLRHSFASLAYHLGTPEQITMRLGGWSDHNTMRKIYTHLAQKDITKYENQITNFFKNANENANGT
ncbi:MAG: site-specific integrase [Bacillota bacterium]